MQTKTKSVNSKAKKPMSRKIEPMKSAKKTSPFVVKFRKLLSNDPEERAKGMRIEPVLSDAMLQRMYERVLKEKAGTKPNYEMTKLEKIIRDHVQLAIDGDDKVADEIFCRIWGTDFEYLENNEFADNLDKNSNFHILAGRIEVAVKAKEKLKQNDNVHPSHTITGEVVPISVDETASPTKGRGVKNSKKSKSETSRVPGSRKVAA
jgi:hypothetical protein